MHKTANNETGFTVVELLVSIVVAGVLLGSINSLYTTHLYLRERVRDSALTNAYIESKVEALRSAGYLAVPNGTVNISSELPAELNKASGTMTVSDQTTAVKRIALSISYSEQGATRTYNYTTYLGELGVGQ